jgi:hypothetical protein
MGFYHIIWLVVSTNPSENDEFVSWDDDIPNIWKVIKHVPNYQPIVLVMPHFMFSGLPNGQSPVF